MEGDEEEKSEAQKWFEAMVERQEEITRLEEKLGFSLREGFVYSDHYSNYDWVAKHWTINGKLWGTPVEVCSDDYLKDVADDMVGNDLIQFIENELDDYKLAWEFDPELGLVGCIGISELSLYPEDVWGDDDVIYGDPDDDPERVYHDDFGDYIR